MSWLRVLLGKLSDRMRLFLTAVLVCVMGIAAFMSAYAYHFSEDWVIFGLNSVVLIAIFARRFGKYWNRIGFNAFFALWMAVHGLVGVILIHRIPFWYWTFFILVEFTIGTMVAKWLFGAPLSS